MITAANAWANGTNGGRTPDCKRRDFTYQKVLITLMRWKKSPRKTAIPEMPFLEHLLPDLCPSKISRPMIPLKRQMRGNQSQVFTVEQFIFSSSWWIMKPYIYICNSCFRGLIYNNSKLSGPRKRTIAYLNSSPIEKLLPHRACSNN